MKPEIKLGDKFLCKKTNKGHDNDIGVDENIWYEVVKIDKIPRGMEGIKLTRFLQVNDGKSVFNISFRFTEDDIPFTTKPTSDYIWDYFYTPKELRKKKLDEIENR